ncbi:hypothetical protein CAPTEDRAFT_105338 [Capitella teleta]|uniref:HAT C-terminal dimerisation domain-containing protein n=1 Tax=Capitella teleta TaxID=283909 RepID=R7UX55_CAPTE|nr:hypothetical protein CAPTEDRAFT_105338 [Capitella teleta]|eukprot:ELU10924.1 hypothetical protein CAPTEDRAFT_105338 [Capitella teleta]
MHKGVLALCKRLAAFLMTKNRPTLELQNRKWICDLAFLVNITNHLNSHNKTLQGKDLIILDLLARVKASRFPEAASQRIICSLSDVRACEKEFLTFLTPFDVNTEEVAEHLRMEIIKLQCYDAFHGKFKLSTPLEFWRSVAATGTYPAPVRDSLRIPTLFGLTYPCEQLFSKMKYAKCKTRSLLTDQHLDDTLLLASFSNTPDIDRLLGGRQHQSSH